MIIMHYRFTLPADYDMGIIEQRISLNGARLMAFQGWWPRRISTPAVMMTDRIKTVMRRSISGGRRVACSVSCKVLALRHWSGILAGRSSKAGWRLRADPHP